MRHGARVGERERLMFVQTTKDVGAELESAATNKEDKEEIDVEGFSRDLVRVSVETPAPADVEA